MRYGITGHQERLGIDWAWVENMIRLEFGYGSYPVEGLSCLAKGADQVFAEAVLSSGGILSAVVPKRDYQKFFHGVDLNKYLEYKSKSKVIQLPGYEDDQESFYAAGVYIVDNSEKLVAVWDGEPSKGWGGTADIVSYATKKRREVAHINPITFEVMHHNA